MKLTKFTNYTVELNPEEFSIIGEALYLLNENPSYGSKNPSLLEELSRRFYEKEWGYIYEYTLL